MEEVPGNPFDEDEPVQEDAPEPQITPAVELAPVAAQHVNVVEPVLTNPFAPAAETESVPLKSEGVVGAEAFSKTEDASVGNPFGTSEHQGDVASRSEKVGEVSESVSHQQVMSAEFADMKDLSLEDDEEPETEDDISTLSENVLITVGREIVGIGLKVWNVLFPFQKQSACLKDWDLWGPLIFGFALALALSVQAQGYETETFSLVFCVVWGGSLVIAVSAILLGSNGSWFQVIFALGYCLLPLDVSALMVGFWSNWRYRMAVSGGGLLWSTIASWNFMTASMLPNKQGRTLLLLYPVFIYYLVISWMVFIIPYT